MTWTNVGSLNWRGLLRKLLRTIAAWGLLWLFGAFLPIFLGLLWLAQDIHDLPHEEIVLHAVKLSVLFFLILSGILTGAVGSSVTAVAIASLGFWMSIFGGWAGFVVFLVGFLAWYDWDLRTFLRDALKVWLAIPGTGKVGVAGFALILILSVLQLSSLPPYERPAYTRYDAVLFAACADIEADHGFAERAALFRQAAAFVASTDRPGPPVLKPPADIAERCIWLEPTAVIAAAKPVLPHVP